MILIDNEELWVARHTEIAAAVTSHPSISASSEALASSSLGHADFPERERKFIYVLQGETASVEYEVDDAVLASDDATTCVIAAAVCRDTGVATIAHFDELTSKSRVCLDKFLAASERSSAEHDAVLSHDLYLLGGMVESSGVGLSTLTNLLWSLHRRPGSHFHLRLACVQGLNTLPTGHPRHRSLALDPSTAEVRVSAPPVPPNRGPQLPQRLAHHWLTPPGSPSVLVSIYDAKHQEYALGSCTYTIPRWLAVNAAYLLTLDSETLLCKTSTSPFCEGPNFVRDVRAAMKFIVLASAEFRDAKPFAPAATAHKWDGHAWIDAACSGLAGEKPPATRCHSPADIFPSSPYHQPVVVEGTRFVEHLHLHHRRDPEQMDVDVPGSSWSSPKPKETHQHPAPNMPAVAD